MWFVLCMMIKLIMMSVFLGASRLAKNYTCLYAYVGGVVGRLVYKNTVYRGWTEVSCTSDSTKDRIGARIWSNT